MDRILPVAAFEKDVIQNGGKSAIQINITGVGTADVKEINPNTIQPKIIDGESGEVLDIREFDCTHTGKNEMDDAFLAKLDQLREECGFPFRITSGYRDETHPNEVVKSTPVHTIVVLRLISQ